METQTKAPAHPTSHQRTPRTPLGKKLLEIRQRIVASGRPLLDWEDIDREIAAQHIAAAKISGAEELITTERLTTALFRVAGLAITTIRPTNRL